MTEKALFNYMKDNHFEDLVMARGQMSRWDCYSPSLRYRLELKCRKRHYNTLLLEKSKFDSNQIIKKDNSLILEFFPSLNSPYTYISFKRVERLIDNYPIKLLTKPVLPMLMRNMKIPTHKGKYILSDSAREGRKYGSIIKDIYSPIGSPANKAYSLFPIIDSYGLGFRYLEELTKASFFYGFNIGIILSKFIK